MHFYDNIKSTPEGQDPVSKKQYECIRKVDVTTTLQMQPH